MTGNDDFAAPPWPSAPQTLLLRAALAADGSAVAWFERWLALVDFKGELDEASYRLLPLVWFNLRAQDCDHPLMPRLKGIYRNSWVKAARRSALAADLLQSLHDEGIPTLVTKGLPVALVYYPDAALRPMSDIDLLVPYRAAPEAGRLLEAKGFRADRAGWIGERALNHAVSYLHPDLGEVDLHWHVLFDCPRLAADAFFWDSALPMTIKGAPTLRPCATDLLLQVIVHGVRWNLFPPMRWIVDAAMILRSGEAIDWERLAGFARRHRLSLRIRLALTCLQQRFGMPIPARALDLLQGRNGLLERLELTAMRGETKRRSWRHVRYGLNVARLLGSDHAHNLPVALTREIIRRSTRKRVEP